MIQSQHYTIPQTYNRINTRRSRLHQHLTNANNYTRQTTGTSAEIFDNWIIVESNFCSHLHTQTTHTRKGTKRGRERGGEEREGEERDRKTQRQAGTKRDIRHVTILQFKGMSGRMLVLMKVVSVYTSCPSHNFCSPPYPVCTLSVWHHWVWPATYN